MSIDIINCPVCKESLVFAPDRNTIAVAICPTCGWSKFDTVITLRHLASCNAGEEVYFPSAEPDDSLAIKLLGGEEPHSGNDLSVHELLYYIADMLEA